MWCTYRLMWSRLKGNNSSRHYSLDKTYREVTELNVLAAKRGVRMIQQYVIPYQVNFLRLQKSSLIYQVEFLYKDLVSYLILSGVSGLGLVQLNTLTQQGVDVVFSFFFFFFFLYSCTGYRNR